MDDVDAVERTRSEYCPVHGVGRSSKGLFPQRATGVMAKLLSSQAVGRPMTVMFFDENRFAPTTIPAECGTEEENGTTRLCTWRRKSRSARWWGERWDQVPRHPSLGARKASMCVCGESPPLESREVMLTRTGGAQPSHCPRRRPHGQRHY
jgi:hypothetical protein